MRNAKYAILSWKGRKSSSESTARRLSCIANQISSGAKVVTWPLTSRISSRRELPWAVLYHCSLLGREKQGMLRQTNGQSDFAVAGNVTDADECTSEKSMELKCLSVGSTATQEQFWQGGELQTFQ
jgi:hypothetical protein